MPATAPSYARLTEVIPHLRVTEEPPRAGPRRVGAWELAAGDPALSSYLEWNDRQVFRIHGTRARPEVIAGLGLHRYAWPACLLFTVPWFLHRRVPRLPPADVSLRYSEGRMTVRTRRFSCLPGDPAASLPGATVLPTEEALRAELRAALAEHLGPVLDGFRHRMRRGPRTLWGTATDEITEGLWHVARLLGEESRAIADLTALLPGGTAPYTGSAGFRELARTACPATPATRTGTALGRRSGASADAVVRTGTGTARESVATRDRISCCLFYTVRPVESCATCPRTCDAERTARDAERTARAAQATESARGVRGAPLRGTRERPAPVG